MKKCNTELMKEAKAALLEMQDEYLYADQVCEAEYYEGDEEVDRSFDFNAFMKKIVELEDKQEKCRTLLAISNANTKLVGMEKYTISEGLLRLAILNTRLGYLSSFRCSKKIVKTLQTAKFEGDKDRVKVKEKFYEPEDIDKLILATKQEISALQVAIDRTNLTNMVDY